MGWSHGIDPNRPEGDQDIGYGVDATCDEPGCNVKIDRGLAYVCGSNPFGEPHGCGGFFCEEHRSTYFNQNDVGSPELCKRCGEAWEKNDLTEDQV